MTPSGQSDSVRCPWCTAMVLLGLDGDLVDHGRYLAASRMVMWLAESSRYLLPCEMTDKHGCTIELFARIQVIASPEAE